MPAYLLIIAALLSRVIPHSGWYGFTAVGASLLYFGARRGLREMLIPVAAFAATDWYLTTHVYVGYEFRLQDYAITWGWYLAAIVLGYILLASKVSYIRVVAAALLGPTSFFLVSNYAVWLGERHPGGMYAPGLSGLMTCLAAGIPFYERDLASTALVLALAFGIPALIHRTQQGRAIPVTISVSPSRPSRIPI